MKKILFWLSYILMLVLFAGLLSHSCWGGTVLARYTPKYAVLIAGMFIVVVGWKGFFALAEKILMRFRMRTRIILSISLLVLITAALEIAVRVKNPYSWQPKERAERFHPYLQNRLIPGDKKLHVNSDGFRGEELKYSHKKAQKTQKDTSEAVRIFMIGGSTVLSGEVAYTNSHPYLLQEMLKDKYPDMNIQVLNAGDHWHCSQHSLIKYATVIRNYDPDVVIVWHAINDFYRSFTPGELCPEGAEYRDDYSHFYGSVGHMAGEYFTPRSHPPVLNLVIIEKMKEILFSDLRDAIVAKKEHDQQITQIDTDSTKENVGSSAPVLRTGETDGDIPSLKPFGRNMRLLVKMMKDDGVDVILASQPYLFNEGMSDAEKKSIRMLPFFFRDGYGPHLDMKSVISGMDQFNAESRLIAEESASGFVDLEKAVPKSGEYFVDDCHYTEAGNRKVAETIFEYMVEKKVLASEKKRTTNEHK